jgi:tRNA-modifying protein YgfZ
MLSSLQALNPQTSFDPNGIPLSFGNDAEGLAAATDGVAVYDASHWGRLEMSDADRLTFLHNQSTNTFKLRQPGEGCDTVFLTSTARTIDLATAYILPESVLLTLSPGMVEIVMKFLDRYIFFADKVKLTNLTEQTVMFRLIGAKSDELVQQIGAADLVGKLYGTHQTVTIGNHEARIAVGSGLNSPGYTLVANADAAIAIWQKLVDLQAVPIGETVWEQLRVQQGRPMPGQELTEDFNPLEAGLWSTISFDKGCYIGQETIARLDTYNGVKQNLWGFQTSQMVEPGAAVMLGEDKVGQVTSVVKTAYAYEGMVYVRTKAGGAGLGVTIENQSTELKALPFLRYEKE